MRRLIVAVAVWGVGSEVAAQAPNPTPAVRQVSLADALKLAERGSEEVQIANAAVQRARGQ